MCLQGSWHIFCQQCLLQNAFIKVMTFSYYHSKNYFIMTTENKKTNIFLMWLCKAEWWDVLFFNIKTKKEGKLKRKKNKAFLEWITRIHFMVGKNNKKEDSRYSSEVRKIKIHERKIIIHKIMKRHEQAQEINKFWRIMNVSSFMFINYIDIRNAIFSLFSNNIFMYFQILYLKGTVFNHIE